MKLIYLIGSLRNPKIPLFGNQLRDAGFHVFDDWYSAGPEADDHWQVYEKGRGHTLADALQGFAADNVFSFDRRHLDQCDAGILMLPAGKSGHLELGYLLGQGKRGYVLYEEEPERWDVMYRFANAVFFNQDELVKHLESFYGV